MTMEQSTEVGKAHIGLLPIAAIVLGLLAFCLSLLAGVPAIVCGIFALRRIRRDPAQ